MESCISEIYNSTFAYLGCHYPCEKCGSRMCGPACQKNRDYIIESFFTEIEPPRIRKHPYYNP